MSNSTLFLPEQHASYFLNISLIYHTKITKISLLFFGFFSQDMTFVCMLSLNLTCSGYSKTFFGSGFCLHLRHLSTSLYLFNYLLFLGEIIIIMRFPSILGIL